MPVTKSIKDEKNLNNGPYLAKIVSHVDPFYMGSVQVELLRDVGNLPERTGQMFMVKYLSPFYGVTGADYIGKNNEYADTQKSYGMWMVPPDVGTIVMVIFIEGNPKYGYWIGCVPDAHMNFMIPGYAATSYSTTGEKVPVAEYNKQLADSKVSDTTKIVKPEHPFTTVLKNQGLLEDETRGITTSSARREVPSSVFGISTPGPVDRTNKGRKGRVGQYESKVETFIGRLGGSSFVMDDGDANYLRKDSPGKSPPEYVNVANGETGGNVEIPHNELIRIRTRTGHQILLHNSEDLIYIANSRGTAWIELSSNGKIDIYAADSISMHTKEDFNITSDKNINLKAKEAINIRCEKSVYITGKQTCEIYAGTDGKIRAGATMNIMATTDLRMSAAAIYSNGPPAMGAEEATDPPRVPDVEPWAGHENLHEQDMKKFAIPDTFKKIGK